jgi:phytoene synthase
MTDSDDDFRDALKRTDPDRWLSARFIADEAMRNDVLAVYAFDGELARAPRVASSALMGEIRLTWWREALDEIFAGRRVRGHPVAQALAEAVRRRDLPREPLGAMIDARYRELDARPFGHADALKLAEGTAGRAAEVAGRILGETREAPLAEVRACGGLWALSLLLLNGRIDPAEEAVARSEAAETLASARTAGRGLLGVAVFPAVAPATLADAYLRGARPSELARRLRLTWAVARGRI